MHFEITLLPKIADADTLQTLAQTFRQFRLLALQSSPNAYTSTFEQEVEFPFNVWLQRLQDEAARHIVATVLLEDEKATIVALSPGDWAGLIVILEKQGYETPDATSAANTRSPFPPTNLRSMEVRTLETWYQLNALFVHPGARRQGLGKALIERALEQIKRVAAASGIYSSKVVIHVDSWNEGARALYSSCGFEIQSEDECQIGGETRDFMTMSITVHMGHQSI